MSKKNLSLLILITLGLCVLGYERNGTRNPAETSDADLSPSFMQALGVCANLDSYQAAIAARTPVATHVVNGFKLSDVEQTNVEFIRDCIFPLLPGELGERVDMAAKVSWWALREGILELPLVALSPQERRALPPSQRGLPSSLRYSSCHNKRRRRDEPHPDEAGFVCPSGARPGDNPWQVGIAAAQVDSYSEDSVSKLGDEAAARIVPNGTTRNLLSWTAILAGFEPGTAGYENIVSSTGRLRKSWLMRNPIVAFTPVKVQEVDNECVHPRRPRSWCTTHGYPAANRFGKTRRGMNQSIVDLRRVFAGNRQELVLPALPENGDDERDIDPFPNAGEIPDPSGKNALMVKSSDSVVDSNAISNAVSNAVSKADSKDEDGDGDVDEALPMVRSLESRLKSLNERILPHSTVVAAPGSGQGTVMKSAVTPTPTPTPTPSPTPSPTLDPTPTRTKSSALRLRSHPAPTARKRASHRR